MDQVPDIDDPLALFGEWLEAARASEPNDPNAMALATVGEDGMPSLRMVLLKGFDARGFVFYTNLESRKGRQLLATPKAALLFHWKSLRRQVRVEGPVESVSRAEADEYFATRPHGSQIGAWASRQSRPLSGRAELVAEIAKVKLRFAARKVPRPDHWSGFRVVPRHFEFWQDGHFRLHDRVAFDPAEDGGWTRQRLFP